MPAPRPPVSGIGLDANTRCAHYHTPADIIAIKMHCCQTYFACNDCHTALASHPIHPWPQAHWDQPAILCGICSAELTIHQYLASPNQCPACQSPFNPRCRLHHHIYFATT